jgi:DNA-binding NtrC family response regulator
MLHSLPEPEGRVRNQSDDEMDVLIIDDEELYGKMLVWALRRMVPDGWDVQRTTDAVTGGYLAVMDPDLKLVLLDYLMPKKFGLQVAEEALEARPKLRGRIIVASGNLDRDVRERFEELGCHILLKPFELEDLEKLVHSIIGPQTNA